MSTSIKRAPLGALVGVIALQLCAVTLAMKRGCPTGNPNGTYASPPLPLPYDGYLPAIDNETMFLHYTRHAGGAVNNVNAIIARYPALLEVPLAELVTKIGVPAFDAKYGIAANDSFALRNNAGSMYNHAIFWRIMTSYNTSSPAALGATLAAKISAKWGSPLGMLDALRAAGGSVFGSGWAWLVYRAADESLAIVTTPNQDNPLMRRHVAAASRGIPIFGVDVWEHAYYLKYRNVRAAYLSNWVSLVDWSVVQRNYELAERGHEDSIYC